MDAIFWGCLQRFVESSTEAAPTLLVGLVIAAIFRRLLGPGGTRRLFGEGTRWSLPCAWGIGMLLPVCSLGVIPIARELRRDGLSGGTILAFSLTAPLFNPLSVLYGLSLSEPLVILSFAMASLIIVTGVGVAFDALFPKNASNEPEPAPVAYGSKRMVAVFVAAARELASPTSIYILVGLLGVVALNAALPMGVLSNRMEQTNPTAALEMTLVALPAYATPMVAMSQLGSMFQHANSVSAAFVLLTFGAGANIGLLAWITRTYGPKRALPWLVGLLAIVIGLAYAMDKPLTPQAIEPAGHTHAFDIYCNPYQPGEADSNKVWFELSEEVMSHEIRAVVILGILGLFGLVLNRLDHRWRIEDWLERTPEPTHTDQSRSKFDIIIPGPVLGGIALFGLVIFSVVACYTYYPPAEEAFEDLRTLKTTVLSASLSGNYDEAEYMIPLYQDWIRRIQVSVYLREGQLSPYRRMKAQVLIEEIEELKHYIEDRDEPGIRRYVIEVTNAHRRMRDSFLEAPESSSQ